VHSVHVMRSKIITRTVSELEYSRIFGYSWQPYTRTEAVDLIVAGNLRNYLTNLRVASDLLHVSVAITLICRTTHVASI